MQTPSLLRNSFLRTIFLCAAFAVLGANRLEAAAAEQTQKIVVAANAFLATLDDAHAAKVNFDFNDAAQRKRWSNLPINMAERRGLRMGDLNQISATP
jgi:hypothetical protein